VKATSPPDGSEAQTLPGTARWLPEKVSDRDRIYAEMLRRSGVNPPGWITGRDFRQPTCDGLPEIPNITPRISELRKVREIVTECGPGRIAKYRLASRAELAAKAAWAPAEPEQLALVLPDATCAVHTWDDPTRR